ncbi:MAG: TIGR02147 family protein [Bdellovibrio sp.]
MKSVFEYDDYRKYLADFYQHAKSENKEFSFRFFSRVSGFKSSNFLYLVMNGKSNISAKSADKIAKAMKMNSEERNFFRNLVAFNQAKNTQQKQKYSELLMQSKSYEVLHPLSQAQYRYFERWFYSVIRGLIGLPGSKDDPGWMANQLQPKISKDQAKEAIEELLSLGLIQRDSKNRKLKQSNPNVTSTNSFTSSSLAQFHKAMADLAIESIDRFPRERRELNSLTVGISSDSFLKIKELTQKYIMDIVEIVDREQEPDKLYQLNIHLFPVADPLKKEA